jgi:hypothetical protein
VKRTLVLVVIALIALAESADAARVRVRRGPAGRTRVTVRTGFPIRRTLPNVVVRPAPVVRVAPRVYLAPVAFAAVAVASIPDSQVWHGSETLEREDGWTDFTQNVDRRGDRLLLQIERGAAQLSFAEVVFESGDAQVVDFDDRTHGRGVYALLDFKDGRKVDHVRVVAKAAAAETEITLRLVN